MTECEICGASFDSSRGANIHESTAHGQPWHNEKKLRQLYVEEAISSEELGRRWGCDSKTVRNNLERYGIERRSPGHYQEVAYAGYRTEKAGYSNWWNSAKVDTAERVAVHRLLAVSKYGFDALEDNHVHHRNGIKWDNRPENIELVDPSDHAKIHIDELDRDPVEGHYVSKGEMIGHMEGADGGE